MEGGCTILKHLPEALLFIARELEFSNMLASEVGGPCLFAYYQLNPNERFH